MTADVARITDLPEDEDVDFDLDAEDVLLREAIGQPVRIKVGGKVIEVPHPTDWPHTANKAATGSDFAGWAAEVLSPEDYKVFSDANLRNYQINAIFEQVNRRAGVTPGKSQPSARSSKSKARR